MNKFITHLTSTSLLIGTFVITGCSSDDAGPSGPAIPTNAIAIDASNAFSLIQLASVTGHELAQATYSNAYSSSCTTGTSSTTVVDNFGVAMSWTNSGVITFTDCEKYITDVLDYYTFTGDMNFSTQKDIINYDYNTYTYDLIYNDNISVVGAISIISAIDNVIVTGYSYGKNGMRLNWMYGDDDFNYNKLQFTYESAAGNSFAAQVTTPLTGLDENTATECPTAGVLLVSGDASSKARATFNADRTVLIEYNTGDGVYTTDVLLADCTSIM